MTGLVAALGLLGSTITLAADTAPASAPVPATKPVSTSNKWRVEFDGKADAAGAIAFAVNVDGVTTTVTTQVPKGTSENSVARLLVKELDKQETLKKFHFETDDGEAVYFKKKLGMGVPDFGVTLVSNSVTGLKIKVKKD